MKAIIHKVEENADGSANAEIEFDKEFLKEALQHYLEFIVFCGMNEDNDEYIISKGSKTDDKNQSTGGNSKEVPVGGEGRDDVGTTCCSSGTGSGRKRGKGTKVCGDNK